MPTYTFYIYSVDALSYNGATDSFDLDAGYLSGEDRYRIDVNDDDAVMNDGGDPNQTAIIYDLDDNIVDSGNIFVPAFAAVDDGSGGTIFLDRIEVNGVHYGYVSTQLLTPGTSYALQSSGTFEEDHTYYQANSVPCFGPVTLIETPSGPRQITQLAIGDLVLTRDHGPQPIVWAGAQPVSSLRAVLSEKSRPIQMPAHLWGMGAPSIPLILSHNHRVLLEGPLVDLMTSHPQVFVSAGHLAKPGKPQFGFVWHHILLPQHEVIRANGIWVESLFSGDALADLIAPEHYRAIRHAVRNTPHHTTARPCLRAPEARAVVHRLRHHTPRQTRNIRVA